MLLQTIQFLLLIVSTYAFNNLNVVRFPTTLNSDPAITGAKSDLDYGKCPGASKCKGEYRGKGCDGNGKIQGGIATVPLFSWWPIKVYRPCPAYQDAGYVYRREGQTMDQVLFSEPSTKMQEKMAEIRKAESDAKKVAMDVENENSGEPRSPLDKTTDAEKKFLEDAFGKE